MDGTLLADPAGEDTAQHRRDYLRQVYQEGCRCQAEGRHAEAAILFAAATARAPDFADAHLNLGCALFAMERFGDAATAYSEVVALRPGDAGAHFNLGMALLRAGAAEAAVLALRQAAKLAPELAKHHLALADALIDAGQKAQAVPVLVAAAGLQPEDGICMARAAGLLIDLGKREAAAGAALEAVRRAPDFAYAHGNLATALQGLGKSEQAYHPAMEAVRLAPLDGALHSTVASVLYSLGLYGEALAHVREACRLAPELVEAKANAALVLEALGELGEAEDHARAALALRPNDPSIRFNLAALLLGSGRLTEEAWTLYEGRLQLRAVGGKRQQWPRWHAADFPGKTVLLHAEQGFGDTIQFARYTSLVKAAGAAHVALVVQPHLLRLMTGTPGADAVIPALTALPPHDILCPLASLPGAFATGLDSIPPPQTLQPDPALVAKWAIPRAARLEVGLVWAGSTTFSQDRNRSLSLAALAPLFDVPGTRFHSLQFPPGPSAPLLDRMAEVEDFADTAAIIAGLDLVITVDTGVAHLAATMGKPVWLLARHNGCWRWLREGEDSPWYPTLRIYRQDRPLEWGATLARLRADLALHATGQLLPPPSPWRQTDPAPRSAR